MAPMAAPSTVESNVAASWLIVAELVSSFIGQHRSMAVETPRARIIGHHRVPAAHHRRRDDVTFERLRIVEATRRMLPLDVLLRRSAQGVAVRRQSCPLADPRLLRLCLRRDRVLPLAWVGERRVRQLVPLLRRERHRSRVLDNARARIVEPGVTEAEDAAVLAEQPITTA